MEKDLKILSYKEYVETCRRVVENCTGFNTKGEIWDNGLSLVIDFGVEDIWIRIYLYYDPLTHYWKTSLGLFVELEYKDDEDSWKALGIINHLRKTILELLDTLSDCRVDYEPVYKAGNSKQYEWDLYS